MKNLECTCTRNCSLNNCHSEHGITLIALVVTLVVLLILAGITISIVLSEGGIVAKAQSSKEKQEVGVWLDRLTVTEANTAVNYYAVDMEKYNAQLKTEGIVLEDNSNYQSEDGGKTYNLTTDNGYVFNISEPTPGDIVINYIGKNGELLPYIKEIKAITTTTNSAKIEVEVARLEDGKLTYEYKKHTEENYILLKESKELTAEFTELAQNEIYDIKVTAENKNGKSEAKIISIYTGELQEGTISQKGETIWTNGQASIELQTTDTENTMQYQKNGIAGTWTNYEAAITGLIHGDIIYARMFDGVNGTSPFSVNIMDGIAPTVTITNSSSTTNSVTVTANSTDAQSGMVASPTYTFYRKVSNQADTSYIKDQEGTNATYTKTGLLQNTTYTIKVEAKDKAGNIGSITKNITTTGVGGAEGGLTTGNIVASSPTWSSGTASITLSTSTSFTIQYQKNSITGTWTTGSNVTGLNHNDTVYARLTDGTNYGDSASVSIMDGAIPQNATINLSKTTTDTATPITATVTQIDNESGVDITKCKWVYNTTAGAIGTAEASYIGETFSSNPQTISLNTSTAGTYYLHVLTIDKAGNKKESISNAVIVNQLATGITLNQTSATMYTGDTLTLTATVTPSNTANKNVTWTSSNTAVATVTNGIVTAKSAGSTAITATTIDGSNKTATCSLTVKQLTIADIKAGDYVAYTGGGYSSWRVLWEANNSTAGNGNSIQIISTGSVKNITLGNSDFNTSKNSYNSAITTLNNEATAYINTTYASDVRCVGSIPNNKNSEATTYFTSSESWFGSYNGLFKNTDTNYEKDWNKMNTLGIQNINSTYWLDSRHVYYNSGSDACFRVRCVGSDGGLSDSNLYVVSSWHNRTKGYTATYGFRPVVSLKPNIKITGGNGTQSSPWQLGI